MRVDLKKNLNMYFLTEDKEEYKKADGQTTKKE